MPELISKILPSSVAKFVNPILGAGTTALGVATGNPALIAAGASSALSSLAPGTGEKLQLPQIPKFGGGAAPSFAPPPPDFPITPGAGLSPTSTSGFTAPSATASTGPGGGGDFSAAIAQAVSQILGQGSGGQQQDAFSGQFGGQ